MTLAGHAKILRSKKLYKIELHLEEHWRDSREVRCVCDSHANDWEFNPQPPWSCLFEDEILLNHSFKLTISWAMLAAIMVPRESLRRKKSGHIHKKRAFMLNKWTVWDVGNKLKRTAENRLLLIHCRLKA